MIHNFIFIIIRLFEDDYYYISDTEIETRGIREDAAHGTTVYRQEEEDLPQNCF